MIYSDLSNDFDIDPITGGIRIVEDLDAVRDSIENILGTPMGQRVMLPTFASNIKGILFEPLDPGIGKILEEEIRSAIMTWDDRVDVKAVKVEPDYDRNSVSLEIICDIKGLGSYQFRKEMKV